MKNKEVLMHNNYLFHPLSCILNLLRHNARRIFDIQYLLQRKSQKRNIVACFTVFVNGRDNRID